ncbi:EexN family lipoprotein [Xanthomonas hortorum]|uniref:EexN family lipoprotein n=1 Tax=Xanthomonas hortorum TaxID=56454 RepID=A0AA47ETE8_9XANT|nr:EexN family lipoprotein [Xanthomonas hortorum]WAH65032.1 EexN family lipoprotein [Xanthomonas hortorum]
MRGLAIVLAALPLAACSPPAPTDTVESLVANPERLKELRRQCQADRAKLGDALCNAVAEATRRRFLGDGVTPYTPSSSAPKN